MRNDAILPPTLSSDRTVSNLLSNASKYSTDGTEVTIRAKLIDDALQISVWDQGIGIASGDVNGSVRTQGSTLIIARKAVCGVNALSTKLVFPRVLSGAKSALSTEF